MNAEMISRKKNTRADTEKQNDSKIAQLEAEVARLKAIVEPNESEGA